MPFARPLRALCSTCRLQARAPVPLSAPQAAASIQPRPRRSKSISSSPHTSRSGAPRPDAAADDDYYALLLSQPLPVSATAQRPTTPPASASGPNSPTPDTDATRSAQRQQTSTDLASRARVIFGSRLAGPAARAAREESYEAMRARGEGEWIAGTWIPPRPGEPDNCCMSGCVNCVWDGYREELEGWAERRREARTREDRGRQEGAGGRAPGMDDGAGSEGLWSQGDGGGPLDGAERGEFGEQGLFEGVDVGIREFMRTEKRLGEMKRKRKRAEGGADASWPKSYS